MATFKVRRAAKMMQGNRIGGVSNYTDFDGNGRQTMAGTAKVYKDVWIPANAFQATDPDQFMGANGGYITANTCLPAASPEYFNMYSTGSTIAFPVLAASCADGKDAHASVTILAPLDAATTGSVAATLFYTTQVALATAGSMSVWKLHYDYLGTGGSAGLDSGSIVYGACMSTVGGGLMEVKALGNIPSFSPSTSPFVALVLTYLGSNASNMAGSAEEAIFGLRLRYQVDSLGLTT